jgi:hypothetical protein
MKKSVTTSRFRSRSQTDRISNTILRLDQKGHAAVDWSEKKKNGKK